MIKVQGMKKVVCLAALVVSMFAFAGCSGDSAPSQPESFAPLPSAAPGGQGADTKTQKKNDNKAAAPMQSES